jgi:hypothetical protein
MKLKTVAGLLAGIALSVMSAAPALACCQFVAWNPNGERKVYTRYRTEKVCEAALKKVDAELGKKYPHLYPRVGSCEEYK